MFIEEFEFIVEHRSAERMKHVDALSRVASINVIEDSLTERIRRAQNRDEETATIIKILEREPYKDYNREHGLLYKGEGEQKLVIPQGLQKELIKRAHEIGHFGVKKTVDILSRHYYFRKMNEKVENFIVNCLECILAAAKRGKKEGILEPIHKEDTPLHTIHIDHIGPLKTTTKKYKHILVIVDAFTKYTWLFATKSTGTSEIIGALKVMQQHFGNPKRIITDRGTGFMARELEDYCNEENIIKLTITAGMPRGNGQVERINAIVAEVIRKISIEENNQWYKYLSRTQRAINGTHQRSIGTTPFELLFGTKIRTKREERILELIEEESIEKFREARNDCRSEARRQIAKVQEENKRNWKRKYKKATKYEIGDIVAIRRTQQGPGLKLAIKFFGPYKVTRCDPHNRYVVQKVGECEGPKETTSAADFMKPWRGYRDDLEEDLEDEESQEENIEVE